MSARPDRRRRRSRIERLRDKGDVRALARVLRKHDWLFDREGRALDLEIGRRMQAVAALGSIKSTEAEAAVLIGLRDRDPRVRRAAVDALRPAPSPRAVKELAQAAGSWSDPRLVEARAAAVDLLVELGDELHAVEYTQVLIEDDRRASLTADEETAVRQLFRADSGPVAEIFADQLALRLGTADEDERRVVVQTMIAMGEASIGPLVSALDDRSRRHLAASALGALRDTRAVPGLVNLLLDGDPTERAAAAHALGEIRDPGAIEALIHASGDRDADVRDAALEALDRMRGVVLALLGATALVANRRPALQPPDGETRSAPRLSALGADQRSLIQRLLGRQH
jgi:HEAT repeat protein